MIATFLVGLALLASPAADSSATAAVPLEGTWKFRAGDAATWASPSLDDRDWTDVPVPGEWEVRFPGYDGYGWYRRQVTIPAGLDGEPVGLRFGAVGDAFEVYWNGVRIGARGTFPPDFAEGVDPTLLMVPERALALQPGGRHVLAIRVYNDYAYGGLMGGVVMGRYEHLADRRSPGDVVIGGLVSFFIAIGVYHLAFFVRRRAARENLWFAVLCMLVAVYGATFSTVGQAAVVPYMNPYRLGLLAMLAAGPFFVALVYRLFDLRLARTEVFVMGLFAACLGGAVLLPLGDLARFNTIIDAGLAVGLMAIVMRAILARSPHRPHDLLLVAGTAAFAATMMWDLASEYGWVPVAELIPGVPSLFWFGFLVFLLSVGIATAGKWALTEATALVDPLTDLSRRHVFDDALRRETERLRRTGGSLALVLIDLDHFKRVNDSHGHRVGDEVLARVGRLLRHSARNIDLPARIGGEEFAVLLYDTGLEGGNAFAERFRGHLSELQFAVSGGTLRVTASVGVSVGSELVTPDELMETADRALYRAKAEGRDRVVSVALPGADEPQPRAERRRRDPGE